LAQDYDKIFRENIEEIAPSLVQKVFGLRFDKIEKITDTLEVTLGREPDFLGIVSDSTTHNSYILHLEIQVKDEKNMFYRMQMYRAMLSEIHKGKSIKQFIYYIGKSNPKNLAQEAEKRDGEDFFMRYHLKKSKDVSYRIFLQSPVPQEVILAILADFEGVAPAQVAQQILLRLRELEYSDISFYRHITQLEILSKLRDMQSIIIQKQQETMLTYDLETDIRFQQGIQQGIEKGKLETKIEAILGMLSLNLPIDIIAKAIGVSEEFIIQTRDKKNKP
jgi:predicted transposase/invertase (TIGR01784 family)